MIEGLPGGRGVTKAYVLKHPHPRTDLKSWTSECKLTHVTEICIGTDVT